MSTLAASFLDDFDEDEEDVEERGGFKEQGGPEHAQRGANVGGAPKVGLDVAMESASAVAKVESQVQQRKFSEDYRITSEDDLKSREVSQAQRVISLLSSFERLPKDPDFVSKVDAIKRFQILDRQESGRDHHLDHTTFDLVVSANQLCVRIDEEIARLYTVFSDAYSVRFPELVSHVPDPLTYLRAVQLIGNTSDVSDLNLDLFLTPAQAMAVSMTGSKLTSAPLPDGVLNAILQGCDVTFDLHDLKKSILLPFVGARMPQMAPNVVALLGPEVTAQLLALVGGLKKLAGTPANNILVIGKNQKSLNGFAAAPRMQHYGVLFNCSLVQECLPEHRTKAMRNVAGRVALAARVDVDRKETVPGAAGQAWADQIREKLKKWHAPPPGKALRALPAPITDAKKRRGGRARRREKNLIGETVVQKKMNRLRFGESDGEYGDAAMGKSFGMLGKEGSGTIRLQAKEQPKSALGGKRFFGQRKNGGSLEAASRRSVMSSLVSSADIQMPGSAISLASASSGTESNVAFTPAQGIELVNPAAAQKRLDHASDKYFGSMSFKKRKMG